MAGRLQMHADKVASPLRDIIQYQRLSVLIRGSSFSSRQFVSIRGCYLLCFKPE
jgi:hypothetical protein